MYIYTIIPPYTYIILYNYNIFSWQILRMLSKHEHIFFWHPKMKDVWFWHHWRSTQGCNVVLGTAASALRWLRGIVTFFVGFWCGCSTNRHFSWQHFHISGFSGTGRQFGNNLLMLSQSSSVELGSVNIVTFNSAMRALVTGEQWQRALSIWAEISGLEERQQNHQTIKTKSNPNLMHFRRS